MATSVALVAVLISVSMVLSLAGTTGSGPQQTAAVGDIVQAHLYFYDTKGRLLASNDAAVLEEMKRMASGFEGLYVVPEIFKPQKIYLEDAAKPTQLDGSAVALLTAALVGESVGFRTIVPVIGEIEGYAHEFALPRDRGTFNKSFTLTSDELAAFPTIVTENRIEIDGLLTGTTTTLPNGLTRVTLDVHEGQQIPVRRTPMFATIQEESDAQFTLRLSAPVGSAFTLQAACKVGAYVLPSGSYVVVEETGEEIRLAMARTLHPQMMGLSLVVGVEVLGIQEYSRGSENQSKK